VLNVIKVERSAVAKQVKSVVKRYSKGTVNRGKGGVEDFEKPECTVTPTFGQVTQVVNVQ
jgi:hypothetical protein